MSRRDDRLEDARSCVSAAAEALGDGSAREADQYLSDAQDIIDREREKLAPVVAANLRSHVEDVNGLATDPDTVATN